jgi:hypothetical protein
MRPHGTWFILSATVALVGCAAGVVETPDPATGLRLLPDSVSAAAALPEADEPAPVPAASWQVTVAGGQTPLDDEPAPDADVIDGASNDDRPTAQEQPPHEDHSPFGDEPQYDEAVISDGPDESTGDEPRTISPAPIAPQPAVRVPAGAIQMDPEPEMITTPDSIPRSPFKPGGDEGEQDRIARQVTEVPIDIRPTEGVLPDDLAAAKFGDEPSIDQTCPGDEPGDIFCSYTPWTICYRPLYFEDIKLERYGENVGLLQTGLSGTRFFTTIAALPYKMTVHPPRTCQCSNGFSRCGDCPLPGYGKRELRIDASLIEAAAVAGVVYILP